MSFFKNFFSRETGAVTVDWVVITASIVMLGLAVGVLISTPANSLAGDIDAKMQTMAPQTY